MTIIGSLRPLSPPCPTPDNDINIKECITLFQVTHRLIRMSRLILNSQVTAWFRLNLSLLIYLVVESCRESNVFGHH